AGKQSPSLGPICSCVVSDLATPRTATEPSFLPPSRVVLHAVWWVGNHQQRLLSGKQPRDSVTVGAITAGEPVTVQAPDVSQFRHRNGGNLGNMILIRQAAGAGR